MKKRWLGAVLAGVMVLSLAACGGGKDETKAPDTEAAETKAAEDTVADEGTEAVGGTEAAGGEVKKYKIAYAFAKTKIPICVANACIYRVGKQAALDMYVLPKFGEYYAHTRILAYGHFFGISQFGVLYKRIQGERRAFSAFAFRRLSHSVPAGRGQFQARLFRKFVYNVLNGIRLYNSHKCVSVK